MDDRRFSSTVVYSAALWATGVALAVVDAVVRHTLVGLALAFVVAGATLTVRRFFCGLAERERNAFELGRDVQLHAELRSYEP